MSVFTFSLGSYLTIPPGITGKKVKKRGVSHCGLAIYIKKYLKAKEELRIFK
jgi:hypothetical protein